MKLSLPQYFNNNIVKAIAEFNLIEDGDRIVVGLSGGKDSSFLLFSLAVLQKYLSVDFELFALTIDLGFSESNLSYLEYLCRELDIPYYIKKTRIAEYIKDDKVDNPCAKCAYFRRGAIVDFMKKNNYKKLAYGHHYDDAVETFLMSIIYSGQLLTLQPIRHLARNDIYIIRPLIYLRERRIAEAKKLYDYQEIPSNCSYDQKSGRAKIKDYLKNFKNREQIFYNLASAMRGDAPFELWPKKMSDEELYSRIDDFWS